MLPIREGMQTRLSAGLASAQVRACARGWRIAAGAILGGLGLYTTWLGWRFGSGVGPVEAPPAVAVIIPVVFLGFLAVGLGATAQVLKEAQAGQLVGRMEDRVKAARRAGMPVAEALHHATEREQERLARNEGWTLAGATILVTLGLIGTAAGLIQALGGLSDAVGALGRGGGGGFEAGLDRALAGMSAAFVTTLMGSVLGGVALRILSEASRTACGRLLELAVDRLVARLGTEDAS